VLGLPRQQWKKPGIPWLAGVLGALILLGPRSAAQAEFQWPGHFSFPGGSPLAFRLDAYCRQPPEEVARKAQLRQRAAQSDAAWAEYTQVLAEHRAALLACRSRRWPQVQAIWVRLHPCDANPGVLDQVFDQVVNLGYNRVFIETLHDGRSILPDGAGGIWPSLQPNADLLDLALKAARRRGLSAYAWVSSLNFGYSYGQRPDRQSVLARNGRGLATLLDPAAALPEDLGSPDEVFVDPFHPLARRDLAELIRRILQRQPDGILFDYIRYPRGSGASSLATNVRDLWIHGEGARQAYLDLAENPAGRALLERYLSQGYITVADVLHLDATYSEEPKWRRPGDPRLSATEEWVFSPELSAWVARSTASKNWQGEQHSTHAHSGRSSLEKLAAPTPSPTPTPPAAVRQARWQQQLWELSVEFARQGVLDYLRQAAQPVWKRGIPSGAVFFPDGNLKVGEGFDARLQPWDRFDPNMEWHPMAYAKCEDSSCVVKQVERVLAVASPQTFVCPAIAGLWGQAQRNRPSLETQMAALARRFPQLSCVSHFSLSWIEPELERKRRTCQL
jgi:hypothetical protein